MNLTKIKMNLKMEVALVIITSVLCTILLLKILNRLRSALPWRVNCWFCNNNSWVKYPEHNSWTCPKCEQYNGFTKDGDYNKTLIPNNDQVSMTPKVFQISPRNGLCKMCNINQQLKVTQLANFVPMNERNFDEEIEAYRMQLEKAYKLCSPCRRVLQVKLHKEKETLLSTKLLETRSPEKKQNRNSQSKALRNIINTTSKIIAALLLILVSYEFYIRLTKEENLPKSIINVIDIVKGLLDRLLSILTMKIFTTFPSIESYANEIFSIQYIEMLPKSFNFRLQTFDYINTMTQEVLVGIAALLQILANIRNVNTLRYTIAIDLLWIVFVLSISNIFLTLNPLLTTVTKMTSVIMLLLVYKSIKEPTKSTPKTQSSPKPIRKLTNLSSSTLMEQDEAMAVDSDDDVSLSKFGLHNFSESSNETIGHFNTSLMNGRTFTPRSDSLWTKPKLNSTFCVNTALCNSPPMVAEPVFAKPSFSKYQKLAKDDSDSDLDESISSLSLGGGGPTKAKNKTNSMFSLRKFTASPNFVPPAACHGARPLISPSKLGHTTSWVAGGYWGGDSERQNMFSVDGSRSSSQSSGFESQTSSMAARNVFSHPPSREESVCGEAPPALIDRFSMNGFQTAAGFQVGSHNFSRMSTPVFPPMQYNGHVHIPVARPAHAQPHGMFVRTTQYVHNETYKNDMFKIPGASGLIRLPQVNSSFASQ